MKIIIAEEIDPTLPRKLSRYGEVFEEKNRLAEGEVLLIRSKTKCKKEFIDSALNLKLIVRGGVGMDNIDTEYASSKGIIVRNTPRASAIAVAELAFAFMISAASRLFSAHEGMRQGKWLKEELKRTELYGKKLCLVGLGSIAAELAIRASAFGMKVVAFRKSGRPSELADVKPNLAEAVEEADFVSLHTPLTDSTCGMINKEIINKMKDGAVLINTSRAQCVVAEDLVAALKSSKLSAYATDVWPSDPPSKDDPILKAPNVIMTPHLGASSKENLMRIGEEIVHIVDEFCKSGEKCAQNMS
jgi:D-3-phosphoglycerate dehydrogenase